MSLTVGTACQPFAVILIWKYMYTKCTCTAISNSLLMQCKDLLEDFYSNCWFQLINLIVPLQYTVYNWLFERQCQLIITALAAMSCTHRPTLEHRYENKTCKKWYFCLLCMLLKQKIIALLTISLWHFDFGLVAVEADDKSTLVAHPVHIEQSGVANITHLTHPLHSALPRNGCCNTGQKKHINVLENSEMAP